MITRHRIQLVREKGAGKPVPAASPRAMAKAMRSVFEELDREMFAIIALNARNEIVGWNQVSLGSLNASIVHPREVFKYLILVNAASGVVIHNHPSGDPQPSREDREVTRALVEAGRVLDIPIHDHLVLGDDGQYFSFKDSGLL